MRGWSLRSEVETITLKGGHKLGASDSPLIGVPCGLQHAAGRQGAASHGMGDPYVRALAGAGAMPILIPLVENEAGLRCAYHRLDGLLLAGGGDVDPTLYGESRHPATKYVTPERDRVEIALTRWALADAMPILAICRGIQVLNVAAGGTLYQDIADQLPGALKHDYHSDYPRSLTPHTVSLTPGSRLASLLIDPVTSVNSLHHQGIRHLAPGLSASAHSPDGLIEGVEHAEHPFALGVQWHPEELVGHDSRMRRLFEAFVEVARL
jgi:putative glutamine amidotransferase